MSSPSLTNISMVISMFRNDGDLAMLEPVLERMKNYVTDPNAFVTLNIVYYIEHPPTFPSP